jgi:hypothetical protein
MSAASADKPIVHFVGSIPFPDAETVFRTLAAATGPYLTCASHVQCGFCRVRDCHAISLNSNAIVDAVPIV